MLFEVKREFFEFVTLKFITHLGEELRLVFSGINNFRVFDELKIKSTERFHPCFLFYEI